MPGFPNPQDPLAAFAKKIADLEKAVRDLSRPQPFVIPTPAVDPPDTLPGNLWVFPDGRLRARVRNTADTAWVILQWTGVAPGSATSATAPAPPKPAKKSYQGQWNATFTKGYRQNGTKRTDYPTWAHYGYVDSFNGLNRALIGFPLATIDAAIGAGEIKRVRLQLTSLHTYWNSGSDLSFSIHNLTSEPATYTPTGANTPRRHISTHHFKPNQTRTVDLPITVGHAFRDGWGAGLVIDPTNTSKEQYGYIAGVGSGYSVPKLIIDYVK